MGNTVKRIDAWEILTGSGRPTVEVSVLTTGGIEAEASVPSGTSRGLYEATEIYDGGSRYRGRGVRRAVENVIKIIGPTLQGMDVTKQATLDEMLIRLDGTPNKNRLGGNAILPVSVACAKAGAASLGQPCYRYLGSAAPTHLPAPVATVIAGGEHSPSGLEFEDYLLVCEGFTSVAESVEALVETRQVLEELMFNRFGPVPDVGGALAPPISDSRQAFDWMLEAASRAGFGGRFVLGLDVAASELWAKDCYRLGDATCDAEEMHVRLLELSREYPLRFIEDPFHQDDFESFARFTKEANGILVVGDDLFATNPGRLQRGIEQGAGNALLLKVNQIGTVSEALAAARLATRNKYNVIVSLRSNDTNDSFIADFAVAVGASHIKLGSPVRGERNAKYNRLLRIESYLK